MGGYSLLFRKSVAKDLRAIPEKEIERILKRIEALADDPRPKRCGKLTNQERYRLRQGPYHILYEVQDDARAVVVVKVGHRRDVYRA